MSRVILPLLIAIAPLLFAGCAPSVYAPGAMQVGAVEEQGEVALTGRLGSGVMGSSGISYGGQVMLSPIKHVLLHASTEGQHATRHRHTFSEVGLGLYYHVSPNFMVETLGGYGDGTLDANSVVNMIDYTAEKVRVEGDYGRYYGQMNVAFTPRGNGSRPVVSKLDAIGMGLRISRTEDRGIRVRNQASSEPLDFTFAEPFFFIRLGDGPLTFESQVIYTTPLQAREDTYSWLPIAFNYGLRVNLQQLAKH